MKQQKSHYFKWGLTVFLTVCAILAFYDTFYMNGTLQRYLSKLVTVLAPVLYGFAMAYLLAPIVNWIEGLIRKGLKRLSKGQEPKLRGGLLRGVSILLTWAVVAYLLYLLMSVLIPQLIDSVAMLINNAESYYNKIYVWVTNLLEKNPEIAGWVEKNLESYYNDLMKVLTEQVLPGAQQMLTTITGGIWTGIWGLVTFTTNFLVGIIISVYLLAMKEKSLARCCKLLYALLQEEQARWVVRATRKTNQIFSGFVRGKMLDSLIIGILCFIGCSIFSLPYTPLVSVVVGVTNMIPFFGPFLGAVPSAFLILLVSPKQCLIFIVFIIVLQQIDGNIIGPKILGDATGISSFWVVVAILVGGGFGGKEDVTVQHQAALIAYITKRAVKVKLTRKESILVHPKRHPMSIDLTTACDENGRLTAMKAVVVADTGAYASLGGPVLQRACTHAAGPYNYQVIDIDGKAVYTNNPPAGAFRGFGVTQTCFATEMNINLLAEMCGMDPWQFRYLNAIRPGRVLPNGQIADPSTGLAETLEAVKDIYYSHPYVGIGCAMKNAGVGVGLPDTGRVRLIVEGGKVHIHSGASCIGQGVGTVLVQMLAESAGISMDEIEYHRPNTSMAPDSGTTSGSRQTLVTGEACRRAAKDLRRALFEATGRSYEATEMPSAYLSNVMVAKESPETAAVTFTAEEVALLNGKEFYGEYLAKTDKMGADVEYPVSHVAYGYATQLCILKEDGTIEKMVGAHDVGKVVNPKSAEGQVEGGIVMGCGYALTEQYPLKDCVPTAKYGTLGLFRADKAPEVESIIVEKPGVDVAFGAIGIGEITSIPTAPAIADAYFRYDHERRYELPLKNTPYERKW